MSAGSGSRILVAEDEPSIRRALAKVLEGRGHSIRTAANGRQALELMEQEMPELLVLDLAMPEMGGIAVLEEMRRRGWKVPVVIMTGNHDLAAAKASLRLGAREYLLKPFDIFSIGETVHWHLAGAEGSA